MMERVKKAAGKTIEVVGLMMAMLGTMAMDSADMRYPAAILAAGVIMMCIGMRLNPLTPGDLYDDDWDD